MSEKVAMMWQKSIFDCEHLAISAAAKRLLAADSLTQMLRGLHSDLSVELLHWGQGECGELLQQLLPFEHGWQRDVCLRLQGKAVLWARSFCAADDAAWLDILNCGTQPLGERLFNGSLPLTRSAVEFYTLPAHSPAFLARRSVFSLQNGGDLALLECFLPDLKAFLP